MKEKSQARIKVKQKQCERVEATVRISNSAHQQQCASKLAGRGGAHKTFLPLPPPHPPPPPHTHTQVYTTPCSLVRTTPQPPPGP
jgi:hypothetical protein